jgi:uncharacterized protein YndB with AHSA1/START domain
MSDRIQKTIVLRAPIDRVWQAITDHREFGAWFRVDLDNPFVVGGVTSGKMTYPGHEGAPWSSTTTRMEAPNHFAFTWPHAGGGEADLAEAPTTLVEFYLEPAGEGTRLIITESGFDALPPDRRASVMRGNDKGWDIQSGHIAAHVEG